MGNIFILAEIGGGESKPPLSIQEDYNGIVKEAKRRDLYEPCLPCGSRTTPCTPDRYAMSPLLIFIINRAHHILIVVLLVQKYVLHDIREGDYSLETILVVNDNQPMDPRFSKRVENRV